MRESLPGNEAAVSWRRLGTKETTKRKCEREEAALSGGKMKSCFVWIVAYGG